jgi:hypothetical protein
MDEKFMPRSPTPPRRGGKRRRGKSMSPSIKIRPTFLVGLILNILERQGFERGGEGGEAPPYFGGVLRGGNPSRSEFASEFE